MNLVVAMNATRKMEMNLVDDVENNESGDQYIIVLISRIHQLLCRLC